MSRLELLDVACGYGGAPVLRDVTLAVDAGEVLAIVGPNAAGKTTLLRTMARLLKPQAGRVLLDGGDLWQRSGRAVARQLAFAPQQWSAELPLSVREAVALGRAPHRGWFMPMTAGDRAEIDRVLADLELEQVAARRLGELSGGQQRRVVLARTLVQEPSILLLDEPTAYLDLKHELELFALVRRLASAGVAVVLTMHDLGRAAALADRVALLGGGALVAAGAPATVLTEAHLRDAYEIDVVVEPHPRTGVPLVTPRAWLDAAFDGGTAGRHHDHD